MKLKVRAHKNLPGKAWAARLTEARRQEADTAGTLHLRGGLVAVPCVRRVVTPFGRVFLDPEEDGRSRAGTGDLIFDLAAEGYYEYSTVVASTKGETYRGYLRVGADGESEEITREDAVRGLGGEVPPEPDPTGLAGLVGSDRQVAWAQDIRKTKLGEAILLNAADPHHGEEFRAAVDCLRSIQSAKWWIDHRGWKVDKLIEKASNSKNND